MVENAAAAGPEAATADAGDESAEFGQYVDAHFTLTSLDHELLVTAADEDSVGLVVPAKLELSFADQRKEMTVTIPVEAIRRSLAGLSYAYREYPVQPQQFSRRVAADPLPSPDDILEDIGRMLWSALFADEEAHSLFLNFLDQEKRTRLVITCTEERLEDMPWECLYISAPRMYSQA